MRDVQSKVKIYATFTVFFARSVNNPTRNRYLTIRRRLERAATATTLGGWYLLFCN